MNASIMNPLGVMQGRLTPSRGRGIQFFPFDHWEEEFRLAAEIGLDEIEFIFDFDRYMENPLWTGEGRAKVQKLIAEHGVRVKHICADFFMRRPFFRVSEGARREHIEVLKRLIQAAGEIDSVGIEIPLVDNASITSVAEEDLFVTSIQACLPAARIFQVAIGLEVDYPPAKFLELLRRFSDPLVRANYDSGNSAGLGYDAYEEVSTMGGFLSNVHIKDKKYGGTSVPLGTGDTDFRRLFQGLREIPYQGSFILQTARGNDGDEVETIRQQMEFVRGYLRAYVSV